MPTYTYYCLCGAEWELSRPIAERNQPTWCDRCGDRGKKLIDLPTVRTFEPYYDEGLHSDVYSAEDRRRIMKLRGVEEIGDPVGGARNFDAKAPGLVDKQPPRGVRPTIRRASDPVVETVDSGGKTLSRARWSELPKAG
jgi:putative FmdB family regulatory protein